MVEPLPKHTKLGKYPTLEVLAFAFYLHQAERLLYSLNRTSRSLLISKEIALEKLFTP